MSIFFCVFLTWSWGSAWWQVGRGEEVSECELTQEMGKRRKKRRRKGDFFY